MSLEERQNTMLEVQFVFVVLLLRVPVGNRGIPLSGCVPASVELGWTVVVV